MKTFFLPLLLAAAIFLGAGQALAQEPIVEITLNCGGAVVSGETADRTNSFLLIQGWVDSNPEADCLEIVEISAFEALIPWGSGTFSGIHVFQADVLLITDAGEAEAFAGPQVLDCGNPPPIREFLAEPAAGFAKQEGGTVTVSLLFNSRPNPAGGGVVRVWAKRSGPVPTSASLEADELVASFIRTPDSVWTESFVGDGSEVLTAKLMGASGGWQWSLGKPSIVTLASFEAENDKSVAILVILATALLGAGLGLALWRLKRNN